MEDAKLCPVLLLTLFNCKVDESLGRRRSCQSCCTFSIIGELDSLVIAMMVIVMEDSTESLLLLLLISLMLLKVPFGVRLCLYVRIANLFSFLLGRPLLCPFLIPFFLPFLLSFILCSTRRFARVPVVGSAVSHCLSGSLDFSKGASVDSTARGRPLRAD